MILRHTQTGASRAGRATIAALVACFVAWIIAWPALAAPPTPEPSHATVSVRWTATRPADLPAPTDETGRDAEAVGRLIHSSVDLEFEAVEFRKALRALGKALDVNILLLEPSSDSTSRSNFDSAREIDLALTGLSGRAALETLILQANQTATWQVQNGIIEVGRREDLARDAAQRIRLYDVSDISIDAPDFNGCGVGRRLTIQQVVTEIARMVSTHCEPDAFIPSPRSEPPPTDAPSSAARGPSSTPQDPKQSAKPTMNLDVNKGALFIEGQWASISITGQQLIVRAPDFVHRAIEGYPTALPPRVGAATSATPKASTQSPANTTAQPSDSNREKAARKAP